MFWSKKNADAESQPATDELPTGITVSTKPEDRPRFTRIYTKQLDSRARVKVEAKTFLSRRDRYFSGELTQPNGRWVLFDPKEVAEKILDPTLVPLIEAFVAEAMRLDRAFMANDPGEFVDEDRVKWQRV